MKTTNTLIFIALSILILTSCTMEKRLYNKGFHVSWNKKYKISNGQEEKSEVYASNKHESAAENEVESSLQSIGSAQDEVAFISSETHEREFEIAESVAIAKNEAISNASNIEAITQESKPTRQSIKQGKHESKAKNASEGSTSGGSSQIVALILVILVGILGIHRFYLGHIGIGILMLLTAGVCGILALVDLIRIITGDLKPVNGEYTETL